MSTEVFTASPARILETEELSCSLESSEHVTTLFLSPEVTHLPHVTSASHKNVNLAPVTHDSCFPERSNQYCKETWCVFFLPRRLSGWVRTGKAGRSKKLSEKWINSSVNLSWAFASDELQKVPPAQVVGCTKALHQKEKDHWKCKWHLVDLEKIED